MPFALLIARQRSGTGALGSVLDKHPQLKYVGEVFHPDNADQPENYFGFLQRLVAGDPSRALSGSNEQNFEEFVAYLESMFPNVTIVIDIKYRSLHHLNSGWHGLVECPWVLRFARRQKAPIIHLTRHNLIGSFVSGRLAEENKVWHAHSDQNLKTTSAVVNPRNLASYIVSISQEVKLINRWLSNYPKLVDVDYDDMFDQEGNLTQAVVNNISNAFNIDPFTDRSPSFIKQAPSRLSSSIENFELIEEMLRGTEHEWMLK